MRESLQSIYLAVPNICAVFVLIVMLTLAMGVMGLEMFSGRMVYCTSPADVMQHECAGAYVTPALDEELGILAWDFLGHHVPAPAQALILVRPRACVCERAPVARCAVCDRCGAASDVRARTRRRRGPGIAPASTLTTSPTCCARSS